MAIKVIQDAPPVVVFQPGQIVSYGGLGTTDKEDLYIVLPNNLGKPQMLSLGNWKIVTDEEHDMGPANYCLFDGTVMIDNKDK